MRKKLAKWLVNVLIKHVFLRNDYTVMTSCIILIIILFLQFRMAVILNRVLCFLSHRQLPSSGEQKKLIHLVKFSQYKNHKPQVLIVRTIGTQAQQCTDNNQVSKTSPYTGFVHSIEARPTASECIFVHSAKYSRGEQCIGHCTWLTCEMNKIK